MAERRIFHASVVESDVFLDLPVGAQALYFHIGMHADDDGFVNGPKQIARKLRVGRQYISLLVEKGFLLQFEDLVVVRHWLVANSLKNDRMRLPRYTEIAAKLYVEENRQYTLEAPEGKLSLLESRKEILESKRNPKGREEKRTEEKGTEEKGTEEKRTEEKGTEQKRTEENIREDISAVAEIYGAAPPDAATAEKDKTSYMKGILGKGVVLLSENQIEELLEIMGLDSFDYYVDKLSSFILKTGAKVKNHYATIVKWWEEDRSVVR